MLFRSGLLFRCSKLCYEIGFKRRFLQSTYPVIRSNIVQQTLRKSNRILQKGEPLQVLEVIPTANLGIQVLLNDGSSYEFCNVWLRDSCQCEFCWDSDHGFRFTDSWLPDVSIQAIDTWITDEGWLGVLWSNGSDTHKSIYQVDWLQEYGKSLSENKISVMRDTSHRPQLTIWQSSNFKQSDLPQLKYKNFISTTDGLNTWLELFFKFGFVILKETPSTDEAIEDMANRIGYIRKTSFGYISEMKVGPESEMHPAYTGAPIQLHTDLTYRERSPGTLSMHCIEAADPESAGDDAGGETKLVDGFQVANWLKHNHPTAYHMLTTIPVPYVYKDPTTGVKYTSYWPVIGLDPAHNINEVHFSNFARQPLRFPGNLILPFYSALKVFTDKLQNPSSQVSFYLRRGDLLTMNNRRVLHARTGFDSSKVRRYIRTCYMDLDEIFGHYDAVLLGESERQTVIKAP